jgi:molybdate transport system substrate-binding protein
MAYRIFLAFSLCVLVTAADAAEITVMADTPVAAALIRIGELFHRQTNSDVRFVFGLSPAIHRKINEGEAVDAVVIQPTFIDKLVDSGKIAAAQYPTVARVGLGLFTRADAAAPDVSTIETFKRSLLAADMLVFSNVAGGNYFATVLERAGIAEAVKARVVRADPPDVITRILQGKGKDIGVISKTLVIADSRLKLIGAVPGEYQSYLVYAAAPVRGSLAPEVATSFVSFLTSLEAKKAFAAAGAD